MYCKKKKKKTKKGGYEDRICFFSFLFFLLFFSFLFSVLVGRELQMHDDSKTYIHNSFPLIIVCLSLFHEIGFTIKGN